ncbi:MAG: 60S ribosomal protein L14 [Amphiamblys sp. WSBS2006]|nr:MAG: 60S ribosomal protein L14 [Amphiamblys sp. WSBS2006]
MERKFVEVGRLAVAVRGEEKEEVCVIVDVVDQKRVIVDAPSAAFTRKEIKTVDLALLGVLVGIERAAEKKELSSAFQTGNVMEQVAADEGYQRISREKRRRDLNDFERFQVETLLQKRKEALEKGLKQ